MTTTEAIAFIGGPLMSAIFVLFVLACTHPTAFRWLVFLGACALVVVGVSAMRFL